MLHKFKDKLKTNSLKRKIVASDYYKKLYKLMENITARVRWGVKKEIRETDYEVTQLDRFFT